MFLPLFLESACGPKPRDTDVPVAQETPEDEVLRIGMVWTNRFEDRGFRSAPNPIATFTQGVASSLFFQHGVLQAREGLVTDEVFKMTDGRTFRCSATGQADVVIRWGRTGNDAALQVSRPALRLARSCDLPGFSEPVLEIPAFVVRFALRGDRLVPYEPRNEQREYIPGS